MFTPYFTTKSTGTGLGLAIVQRIVTDHGGEIRVEANTPRGADFVVRLKAA
ncbi:MAG TPA: ATP-binding protein [bacterium]|nr:ATP-binding protein [bacterium]